ncbi:MAG TPA: winged helix DNA-binding domain-containing protein [Actinomycetota bacterium]|nr:winged helix DNA-binding domain-containing protein [Actinomycetota bacterium]
MTATVGQGALNRALLARQLLLERAVMPVGDVVEHLVGHQAQSPPDPYVGLWSRLDGFDPQRLAGMLEDRLVVRAALMRATIHLVTARDALTLRPLLAPVLERTLSTGSPFGRRLRDVDLDEVIAFGRAMLDDGPHTRAELVAGFTERWPDADTDAMGYAVQYLVPLVQVPPRGVWGKSGRATWAPLEAWLEAPLDGRPPIDDLVRRYLGAFGPATVMDMQSWSGLTRLKEVFERLRPQLRVDRNEAGRELFDLPHAPRPDADTPAPPRFLPEYDNVLLGHADRTRIVSDDDRRRLMAEAGMRSVRTFLLDGRGAGTWTIERSGDGAHMTIAPWARVPRKDRTDLTDEARALVAWWFPEAAHIDVRFG